MIRKIIKIDEEKCNGCGACADACHEGAIKVIDGVAKLVREDYCDGLGDCLPACPANAISFEEREAPAYDEAAVKRAKLEKTAQTLPCGCPGTPAREIRGGGCPGTLAREIRGGTASEKEQTCPGDLNSDRTLGYQPKNVSRLRQWPCQIKLVPVNAPYFDNADLLIAADCTAYAYGNFHDTFMKDRITLIGCPKLDEGDYTEKLAAIISNNNIKSVTVCRMEVPCCGGLEAAVRLALKQSTKLIPSQVVTISTQGDIIN